MQRSAEQGWQHPSRGRGFTIIEIVVSIGIVLLGMLMVARINPQGYRMAALSRDHLTALRLGRSVIEQVRSLPFGASVDGLKGTYATTGDRVEGKSAEQAFTISSVTVDGATAHAATVQVVVAWREGTGRGSAGVDKVITVQGGLCREP